MWYMLFIPELEKHSDEEEFLALLMLKLLSLRKHMGKEYCIEKPHNSFGIGRIRESLESFLFHNALIAPCSLTLSHCDGDWLSHLVFHFIRKTCDKTAGVTWLPYHVPSLRPRLSLNYETVETDREDYELQGPVPRRKGLYYQGVG